MKLKPPKGWNNYTFEMPISNPCMSNAKVLNHRKKHFDENTYINFAKIPALENSMIKI